MSNTDTNSSKSFLLNLLPVWLLIAVTGLDFLSHIPLGGDYSNRAADPNLWRSNHIITNAIFYAIGIWSMATLILNPRSFKSLVNPIMLSFLAYVGVVALSLVFQWPFKLPGWDISQTYPMTMVLRLGTFFLAIAAMYGSLSSSSRNAGLARASHLSPKNPLNFINTLWNILLGFFAIRLCLVWIQSFMLKFPANPADPATETQAFVTTQLTLLFKNRLFYPIRAEGLDFPFLYGPLNANESSTLAIILFSVAIIRLINIRKNNSSSFALLIWFAIALLGFVTILFTQSSATLLLLVITIPIILMMNGRTDVLAIAVFLITAFALFFDEPIEYRLGNYLSRGESVVQRVTDLGGRRYIWQKALSHVKEKPMFGHGYGTDRFVIDRPLKNIEPYNDPRVQHAHSTYVSVLVENGIVGLVPLLLAMVMLWCSCIKKLRQNNYSSLSQEMLVLLLIISVSSLVYIGFFNSVLIIYRWLILIPLLLFAMLPSIKSLDNNA